MTAAEENQLRALVAIACSHRGTPLLRRDVERIIQWDALRAIANGELAELETKALRALEAELRRRQETDLRQQQLIRLLRETNSGAVAA